MVVLVSPFMSAWSLGRNSSKPLCIADFYIQYTPLSKAEILTRYSISYDDGSGVAACVGFRWALAVCLEYCMSS